MAIAQVNADEIVSTSAVTNVADLLAGYGIDAVTMAKDKNPDIIILSLEEPVVRATQTMSSLADALPETPVIVYSSLSDAASVRRAMVSGARDYLVKPINEKTLIEKLKAL